MSASHRRADPGGRRIVVPVKSLDRAKTRLSPALAGPERRRLVLAMAADTLAACLDCPEVDEVLVVTPDAEVAELATGLGAGVVAEPRRVPVAGDPAAALNTSLLRALPERAHTLVGVVSADLPALRADVLAEIVAAAAEFRHAVVTDHLGTGTTMAFWNAPELRPVPRFGPDSARGHRRGGAVDLREPEPPRWAGARRDVDVASDLAAVTALGTGPATAAVLRADTGPRRPAIARPTPRW